MNKVRQDGLLKYPRTRHLEGSGIQKGDDEAVALNEIDGSNVVIEEKFDGANSGVSFQDGALFLQSRGHFLSGGGREKHFNLFKQWARAHEVALREILGNRFIMFGEWMHATHSIFYDRLPHLFLEFDIYDREKQQFLDTRTRHSMLSGSPVVSVPVVYQGQANPDRKWLEGMIGPSLGRSHNWIEEMGKQAIRNGQDPEMWSKKLDMAPVSEGLYIKEELDGSVRGRFKFVRRSFTQTIIDNDEHWQKRPILPAKLAEGADIFSPLPCVGWPGADPQKKVGMLP